MTTEEKIAVLEKAVTLIKTDHWKDGTRVTATCSALFQVCGGMNNVRNFLHDSGISLPPRIEYMGLYGFCWPLTPEGDEQRREFLRQHIERLKKTL